MNHRRIDRRPDPEAAATPAELIGKLRELRRWAGQPSLRRLRQLGGTHPAAAGNGEVDALPESTTSYVLRGDRPASAEFIRSFVAACLRARQCDPDEIAAQVERWHDAWLASAATAASPTDPPPPAPAPPRQLPAEVADFTGRAEERAVLVAGADTDGPAPAVLVITGTAGVGKTALAVHVGHRLADRFPDGQLFIDLRGFTPELPPVEPADALERLLHTLGVPGDRIPAELDDRAALWRTRLAGRRMLILLDNAADEQQVAPLLPGGSGCMVLATSRRRLGALAATGTVSLDLLPQPEAIALFARAAGQTRPDQSGEQTRELVAEAVERCGRLPLAIRIAAGRLRSHPAWGVADLLSRLREQDRLAELTDEAGTRSVATAIQVSYRQLTAEQQRLYRSLHLHPGPEVDPYATAALLETSVARAHRFLDQLFDLNLLQEPTPGRYTRHDLIRAHVATAAFATPGSRQHRRAAARLRDYYRHTASKAMDAAYPHERDRRPRVPPSHTPTPEFSAPPPATTWLDTELPNLLATAHHAADHGPPEFVWQLSATLHRHLRTRTRHRDAEALHQRALTAARSAGHQAGERMTLVSLGWTYLLQSRYREAEDCLRHELTVAPAAATSPAELDALLGLARIAWQRGDYGQAQDTYERVLSIAQSTGDRTGELGGLDGLGFVHLMRGRYEPALACFQQVLAIARSTGDRINEMKALLGLAEIHRVLGRHEPAVDCFQQGSQIALAVGDRDGELGALVGLGHLHRLRGRHAHAIERFERALDLTRACGDRTGELSALLGIGWVHRDQASHEQAAARYQQVADLAGEIGEQNWQFEALEGLGRVHRLAGRPGTAVAHHQQGLRIATATGQPADQARAHDGLAHAYRAMREPDQARQHWRRALDILNQLGTDHTEDEEATAPAIRAHLASLDQGEVPAPGA